jgi:hypothetical protein
MRIRLPIDQRDLAKRGVAAALLAAVVCGISGVPVVTIGRKDRSRPYPCQDRPCGCVSADECWHHCCCFTNKQKVAWAHEHGVTPPDFVIAAADREDETAICAHDDDDERACSAHSGEEACCAHDGEKACCAHDEERACCRSRHAHHGVAASDKDDAKVKFVVTELASRCRGLQVVISLLGDALPCVVAPSWKPIESIVGFVVDAPAFPVNAELSPPVPPPKLQAA